MFTVTIMVNGNIMMSFGPFASFNDAKRFWKVNKDVMKKKFENEKVTVDFTELLSSVNDMSQISWLD